MFTTDFRIILDYVWINFAGGMLPIYLQRRLYILLVLALLEDKQQFNHGEFDKCLMCTSFSGYFVSIFGRIMCLILLFILLFSIYAQVQLFYVFCRILSVFLQHLTINRCILTTLRTAMCSYTYGARKEQKAGSSSDQGRTVVSATDCGEHEAVASSSSVGCVAEIN